MAMSGKGGARPFIFPFSRRSDERCVGQRERPGMTLLGDGGQSKHPWELVGRYLQWPRSRSGPGRRLRIGGRASSVECHVTFHLLHDLMDMAVEYCDGAEAFQVAQSLVGIA